MKKNILLSLCMVMAVTAVMTSCKKDHDFISIRATISDYRDTGKDGKTYIETINGVNWVSWNDNDKVWINNKAYNVTVSNEGTSNRYATFERVTYVDPEDANRDGYYAVYPASQVVSSTTNGFPQILLPQVQIYRTDGTDKNSGNQIIDAPMAAYCQASSTHVGLDFTNLCSLLKIDLSNMDMDASTEVAYITVSSSNKPLWGKATISSGTDGPTLDSPSLTDLSTNNNTVTLDFTDNGSNGSDGSSTSTGSSSAAAHGVTSRGPFYVVLPPTSGVAGLTINIYVFNGSNSSQNRRTILKYTKSTNNNNISIVNNNIYTTGDLSTIEDTDVPDVPFPGLGTGEFSVSSNKKVRFSQGNLQYLASKGMWRFAPNQWDIIGNAEGNPTESGRASQNKWIDLFGFATSGQGNPSYSPTLYSSTDSYGPSNSNINNTLYDWGVNEICNGGNQPNKWRTLTSEEWQYLINVNNNNTSPRYRKQGLAKITVESTTYYGFVLMPDDYTPPTSISDKVSSNWTNPSGFCEFNAAEWTTLSNNGCVFLPCSGRRNILVWQANADGSNRKDGFYWSSTISGSSNARFFQLTCYTNYAGGTTSCMSDARYMGFAVRLVRDVN